MGESKVIAIRDAPMIDDGPGQVVTATFKHTSSDILDVYTEGNGLPLGTTATHPFWSVDRQRFVEAQNLQPGETLRTLFDEHLKVKFISHRGPPEPVYNVTIHNEHTYFIGEDAVLVHNNDGYGDIGSSNAARLSRETDHLAEMGLTHTVVSASQINSSFRNSQRYADVPTHAHHPFFRMFLRAMDRTGQFPQVKTQAQRFRPQNLDYLDNIVHHRLHGKWNDFAAEMGYPVLQTKKGNTSSLARALADPNQDLNPSLIFDMMESFYQRDDIGSGAAWMSIRNFRERLGF